MAILITIVLLTVSISALCSLTESILLSLSRSEIALLAQKHPRSAAILGRMRDDIEKPIAVILFINTCANTMGAIASGWQLDYLFDHNHLILPFSILFAFLVLQFAEILPKTIGVKHRRTLSPMVCRPLAWLVVALSPVVAMVHWINRLFIGRTPLASPMSLVDELRALTALAEDQGQISAHAEKIILNASELNKLRAEHVMQSMETVTCLSEKLTLDESLLIAQKQMHDRYPVIEHAQSRRVLGLVHLKEIWHHATPDKRNQMHIKSLIQQTRQVLLSTDVARLLRLLIDDRQKMLIVVDVTGQALGIITLTDIMSRILDFVPESTDQPQAQ